MVDALLDRATGLEWMLVEQSYRYHKKIRVDKPFPLDPIYEAKARSWMQDAGIDSDVLFWVVGNQQDITC